MIDFASTIYSGPQIGTKIQQCRTDSKDWFYLPPKHCTTGLIIAANNEVSQLINMATVITGLI